MLPYSHFPLTLPFPLSLSLSLFLSLSLPLSLSLSHSPSLSFCLSLPLFPSISLCVSFSLYHSLLSLSITPYLEWYLEWCLSSLQPPACLQGYTDHFFHKCIPGCLQRDRGQTAQQGASPFCSYTHERILPGRREHRVNQGRSVVQGQQQQTKKKTWKFSSHGFLAGLKMSYGCVCWFSACGNQRPAPCQVEIASTCDLWQCLVEEENSFLSPLRPRPWCTAFWIQTKFKCIYIYQLFK